MARRLLDKGKVVGFEFTQRELVKLFAQKFELTVSEQQLNDWKELIPPTRTDEQGELVYRYEADLKVLDVHVKRARVLATQMTVERVRDIEEQGLLDQYADLSVDAPAGVIADVWRSYLVVVLYQMRFGQMLTAEDLAIKARLQTEDPFTWEIVPDVEEARKHLRILQSERLLKHGGFEWVHQGLPQCVQPRD